MSNYLDIAGHAQRTFIQWNTAFIAATAFGFMMKSLEESSRGTFVVLYFLGLFALYTGRAAMVHIARSQARNGGILSVRIAVVGFERDVRKFMGLRDPRREAINVVAVHLLPENDVEIRAALVDTIAVARNRMPDEIYIVVPWSRTEAIDMCISAFMELPVSIHLNVDPDSVINRLANAQLGTNGALSLILRALLADARLGLAHSGLSIYSQGDNPDRVTRRHDTGTLESQLAVLEKLRRKLPGLPFDPAFELGFSYYNLARLAYTHGFVREGRSAEAAARALGIVGHPGSRGHAFLASIMSLAGKQLLAYQVRKVLRMLKGRPGGSAARIRATEDSAGAVGTGA